PGRLRVSYFGPWSSDDKCGVQCYRGDQHRASFPYATATFHFTGTQIALLGARTPDSGIAALSVDGGPETMVDLYAKPLTGQVPNYVSPVLKSGRHTLRVRVTGQKNPASTGTAISI